VTDMFVISIRAGKKQLLAALGLVLGAALLTVLLQNGRAVETATGFSVNAADNAQRRAFISRFGWSCAEEPSEIVEIVLPETVNETYQSYCDLQTAQGFRLLAYAGKRVKRWTYPLNREENAAAATANLYVSDGKVIACDITDSTGAFYPLVRDSGTESAAPST